MLVSPLMAATAQLTYHQRVSREKRDAIIAAATDLFLERGYDRTSLAKVAETAGVSTATLFKRFSTKAQLFNAIIAHYWELEEPYDYVPSAGNPWDGLAKIGRDYACLLTRPGMAALFRIVIAEASRFPELGRAQFDLGQRPFHDRLCAYLTDERQAGTITCDDIDIAAGQFLAMVADAIFWPRMLLIDFDPTQKSMDHQVDHAVMTTLARYQTSGRKPIRA